MTPKPTSKPKVRRLWVDDRRYAFRDLVELTGLIASSIQTLVIRRQFVPAYKQPHGGPIGMLRQTYTARDVMHLLAIAPCIEFGAPTEKLLQQLDREIDRVAQGEPVLTGQKKTVYPRRFAPWCCVVIDLSLLLGQLRRIREYRRADAA